MIDWLGTEHVFPPLERALAHPNGLLAAGGDLSPARLLAAYRLGIFPWFSAGDPILWWSPDPRTVLIPGEIRISRSLTKTLRNRRYAIRFDSTFGKVIEACATVRRDQSGTWIVPAMQAAYRELHALGHAHSVETWIDGELAGGLYGVAIGRAFFGESMFHRVRDASKLALVALCERLREQGFGLIDCQMHTTHLESLGARPVSRAWFSRRLAELVDSPPGPGEWTGHSFEHIPGARSCPS